MNISATTVARSFGHVSERVVSTGKPVLIEHHGRPRLELRPRVVISGAELSEIARSYGSGLTDAERGEIKRAAAAVRAETWNEAGEERRAD